MASRHSTKTATRKKILVVDDHPMTREGLREVISREPDIAVCGEAENARQAVEAVRKLAPDLVLVDITLPGKSGLELVKELHELQPQLSILAISMHDESLYAERMLRAGATGYITKQQPSEELVKAVRQVLDNQVYVSKELAGKLLSRFSSKSPAKRSPMDALTEREFEIFQLIGQGKTAREIARQLRISVKTVAVHNANIRVKFNLKTTTDLILFAVQAEGVKTRAND